MYDTLIFTERTVITSIEVIAGKTWYFEKRELIQISIPDYRISFDCNDLDSFEF